VLGSLENKLRELVGAGKPAKWLKFFHVAHETQWATNTPSDKQIVGQIKGQPLTTVEIG